MLIAYQGASPIVIAADTTMYPDQETIRTQITQKIHEYADKYNVSFDRMYSIIDCETAHTFDPLIQSNVKYNFSSKKRGIVEGTREESYGLAQIHIPDHPNISRTQAEDVDFALDFMASNLSEGRHLWYCEKM